MKKEDTGLFPFEERLKTDKPMEISPQEAIQMRDKFIRLGFNMEIGTDNESALLSASQFRNAYEQRGKGVSAILGIEKTQRLIEWCSQKGQEGGSGKIGGVEGTQGRGLMQAAADMLTIAYFSDKEELEASRKKITKLNQRIWKGLVRKYKNDPESLKEIEETFIDVKKPTEPTKLASIPPGSLPELWSFLTS